MGITDKITGRVKQAAGDITGDEKLRQEGIAEERKGDAKKEATEADLRAEQERERPTSCAARRPVWRPAGLASSAGPTAPTPEPAAGPTPRRADL